jgi:hypothetical protein
VTLRPRQPQASSILNQSIFLQRDEQRAQRSLDERGLGAVL